MDNELLLYANYFHNLGMNISPIQGGNYKNPADNDWKSYINKYQAYEKIQSYDWGNATGIGLILGFGDYRALDIDALYYSQEDMLFKEERIGKVDEL